MAGLPLAIISCFAILVIVFMRVIIHQHRVELTPALTKYIQEKISKLEELLQKSQREHLASVHIGEVGRDQGQ